MRPHQTNPLIPLSVNGHNLKVELASRRPEQIQGLMYRRKLSSNSGMLFVYQKSTCIGFWMKNTIIPLTVAFISANCRIIHIEDMAPETTEIHRSPQPVRYALEVNRGWFEDRAIATNSIVHFKIPVER